MYYTNAYFKKGVGLGMNKRRILAILLLICIAIVPIVLTGCPDGGGGGNDTIEGMYPNDDYNKVNWNGRVFNVLTKEDRSVTQAFNVVDLVEEDNLGDVRIVEAVTSRNNKIKSYHNVSIERIRETDVAAAARNDASTMGGGYDAYMVSVGQALNLALGNFLIDYNAEVDFINLTNPWWDFTAIESLALRGRSYIALGDINTVDDDASWCVLFNKGLQEKDNNIKAVNFYDMVREGEWTTEKMKTYAKHAERDAAGEGSKWDTGNVGVYGLYTQDEACSVLMVSSGNTPVKLNQNRFYGIEDNMKGNESFQFAIDEVHKLMGQEGDDKWRLNINRVTFSGGDVWDTIARGGFKANKALFFITHVGTINLIRDMEEDFGILPLPKLDESQEKYGNTIQYGNATCYAVPYRSTRTGNVFDNDFSAFMLEIMAFYSSRDYSKAVRESGGGEVESLKEAYYDSVLQRKASRDEDSFDMLDIVFGNRIFDISCALNTNEIFSTLNSSLVKTDMTWSSVAATKFDNIEAALAKQLEPLFGKG